MLTAVLVSSVLAVAPVAAKPSADKSAKTVKPVQSDVNLPLNSAPASAPRFTPQDMDLPALGADRRIVLSEMRRVGLRMANGEGQRLIFEGAPLGWPGVEKAIFDFDGMALDQIDLMFAPAADDLATRDLFLSLRGALAQRHGLPWFDRVRDGDAKQAHGVDALALQSHETSWASKGTKVTLSAAYGRARAVKVHVGRDAHSETTGELAANTDDDRPWHAHDLSNFAMVTRLAADSLFDDFGEQPVVIQGAKMKGKPITVRLRTVNIPKNMTGVNEATVMKRFERFTEGHWDVDAVASTKDKADIELEIDVVPLSKNTPDIYAMRLSAVVMSGKQRGETLYSAIQALR